MDVKFAFYYAFGLGIHKDAVIGSVTHEQPQGTQQYAFSSSRFSGNGDQSIREV
jgi:hypothetical protein